MWINLNSDNGSPTMPTPYHIRVLHTNYVSVFPDLEWILICINFLSNIDAVLLLSTVRQVQVIHLVLKLMNVLIQQYFQQNLSLIFPDLVLPNHFRSAWACMYISAGPRSSESPATPLIER